MPNKDLASIHEILNRGTVEVLVKKDLEKKLLSGKKLRIKFGIDPSGADLHIGHMVPIKKLKQFQELGHHIILLFGNFTGQIGDPTGKSETRTIKTQAELEANARHYLNQVSTLLDVKNIEVVWNADWLKKLNFADVVHLSAKFTVAQMMERDMFQDRVKKDQPISVHEFLYPLMQGYDSVALKADVEIGGTDQTFNLLAGRTLQKAYGQTPQDIITVPILEGTDGKIKMGKSTNNYIGVNDDPKDMFGKVMSIPDELILKYFELATEIDDKELSDINFRLKNGENPRDIKMLLAEEIIKIYHDTKSANNAKDEFIKVFSQKNLPTDIPTKKLDQCELNIVDLCLLSGLVESKGEARRLIAQGGVKLDEERVETQDLIVSVKKNKILQVGKRKFINIHC